MSTKPFYIGFHHRKTGTKILTDISNQVQGMEDYCLNLPPDIKREDVSEYLLNVKMEGRDHNEFMGMVLFSCYCLLKITDSLKEQANFYHISLNVERDEVFTDIDGAFVGNNESAMRLFDNLCSELTTA